VDKQKKLKIALPILVVVLTFVWGPLFFGSDKKDKASGSITNKNEVSLNKTNNMALVKLSQFGMRDKARTTYSKWGQNPFMLAHSQNKLVLEGILWDKKNPQVIINGDMVGIGGYSGPNLIIDIKSSSVIIKNEFGEEIKLRLGQEKQF